jgi:uncharacterized membrane protein
MPMPPRRFSQLRWLQLLVCGCAIIGAAALIAFGVLGYGHLTGIWLSAAGGMVLFFAIIILTITTLLLKIEATTYRLFNELRDANEHLEKHMAKLELIAENTRISDAAKSLAHREEELDALRQAIRDDIRMERWDLGFKFLGEMERRFGYEEEAGHLREELERARREGMEAKLTAVIQMIEEHFKEKEWELAQSEIDRLKRLLPADNRIDGLTQRLANLRNEHKKELLAAWDEAVERSDTDHAIEVLKELDQYLTPKEAEELKATARSVFKEKLLQIGVQFRFAVKGKRWRDALDIGLELVREYPNARMAHEVRGMLEVLRERARQTETSGAPQATSGPA